VESSSVSPVTAANRQIARAAGTVMAAFVLSNLTGLVRQILVTQAFGTSGEIDAFNAASTFPDLIFSLIAGGALASAFVPTLTGFLSREDRSSAWRLSSAVANIVFLLLAAASLASALLAPLIVRYLLAPDFSPALQGLTVALMRVLLLTPMIFGVSGLLMGILNSHQVFLWPALAPSMYWLGMILGVLFLTPSLGIFGLAWGAVGGAALHLLVQVPGLLGLPGRRYLATLGRGFPAVKEVARLMVPRLLGVAVVQLNFVVNTILATGQPVGSLSSIKYAWAIMTMPQVVIAQAIAIAALPTFSAQVAQGDLVSMRHSLAATLRGVLLLSIPATVGLILLREPTIALAFQRGEFTAQSTEMVSWALLWYTAGLVGHSVVEIVSRAFYALHDTKTPVFVGAAAMSLNLLFSISFSAVFQRFGWMPHGGLALANSLATALEMAGLLYLMRKRLAGLEGRQVLTGVLQAGAASLGMGLAIGAWLSQAGDLPLWLIFGGGFGLGLGVYALGVWLLKVPELGALRRSLAARVSQG
jgi:putative peptidoglycan lipid II flippase